MPALANFSEARFSGPDAWSTAAWIALIILFCGSNSGGKHLLAAEPPNGEAIYREQCASCHGDQGEGVKDLYGLPLIGDKPVSALTKLISETMPEGSPEDCVGEDAAAVAQYIYDAFYSKEAQQRRSPARIELSRLTISQHEAALADLIGSFRDQGNGRRYWEFRLRELRKGDERFAFKPQEAPRPKVEKSDKRPGLNDLPLHGLRAAYFKSRVVGFRDRVFDQVDPIVNFDFGKGSPHPLLSAEEFAMSWDGSVVAPETGTYEFVVDSTNGTRLFVNDMKNPVIDAVVKSGDQTEYRHTMKLLGGRTYSLRLEYHRSKRDETARVALKWSRPFQTLEVIPKRFLVPYRSPEVFVMNTRFPPDDRSIGFERGVSISQEWDEAATHAALETAAHVANSIDELAKTKPNAEDREEKLRTFCRQFVERAFRRPLSEELHKVYVDKQFEASNDSGTAVKRVVLLTLKSPRFLYHDRVNPEQDDFDIAARLSFGLWDSLPDAELWSVASAGKLSDPKEVRRQAERMIDDPRTHLKFRSFLHSWLVYDRMKELSKDPETYPGFDKQLASDLRTSLDLFLDDIVWSPESDFRELFTNDQQYLNGRLAEFYGVDLPARADFRKVLFEPEHRAGVLTHPFLMSGFAYFEDSSPIHRGVFVARNVLGRSLLPPPEATAPAAPDLHPDLTTRERVAIQTSPPTCMTCHVLINPLGFSLEHFDAAGRFRAEEKGKPIESGSVYTSTTGQQHPLNSAVDLGTMLTTSEEAHEAFAEQVFRHIAKQPIQAYGPESLDQLVDAFQARNFSIRELMVEAVVIEALFQPSASFPGERKPEGNQVTQAPKATRPEE